MKLLSGTQLSKIIKAELQEEVSKLATKPKLVVCLVGNNPASEVYVKYKEKACNEVGIESQIIRFAEDVEQDHLSASVQALSADPSVTGILLQLPIPKHLDSFHIIDQIHPAKDVDCLTPYNQGLLSLGEDFVSPCTPQGIIRLLKHNDIELESKNIVIVGRSNIVGKPMIQLCLKENATVSVCHSKTKDLEKICSTADILIVAAGKKHLINKSMIKKSAVVIDVGIHRDEAGLQGDVDTTGLEDYVSARSPVPGGVGPMTIACLLENTISLYHYQHPPID